LGHCLKAAPHLRDKIEIVSKCGIVAPVGAYSNKRVKHYDTSPAHITHSVERSLRLMNTDVIDLLLIHRPDPFMDHAATGGALDELVASGKVKSVGVSNFLPHDWSLLSSAMSTPLATNQIEISLLANQAFTDGQLAFLQERAISPMAWSPLGGGRLFFEDHAPLQARLKDIAQEFETDIAAVAVAWLLAHPAKIIPVMGTNNLSRIATIGEAMRVKLDRETWFELYNMANGQDVP
jgi:predicted oxidoreductase